MFRLLSVSCLLAFVCDAVREFSLPIRLETRRELDSAIANVHLSCEDGFMSPVIVTYGSCNADSPFDAHHHVATTQSPSQDRLVWRIAKNAAPTGCLSAWTHTDELVGRSSPISLHPKRRLARRDSVKMDNSSKIDAEGPWFDGVATLQASNISAVDVKAAKSKQIAIVGAGMAGLMIWLSLDMAGMTNLTLIEGGDRLGGRVDTAYFGDPSERQYQD